MTKVNYPATLLCDFYKISHKAQYPSGTEYIYSTFTPRSNKYFPRTDKVVVFGIQAFVKKYLIKYFNKNFFWRDKSEVLNEYNRFIKFTLGIENPDSSHIADLHDLGYLPIEIKALKEGTLAPMQVPVLTIVNTDSKFFWLTNYLETMMSSEIWMPMTSATISREYRKILDKYAMKTVGHTDDVDFQAHDFSLRGMAGLDAGIASGAGHLLSFKGTDVAPSILYHEVYYNANIEEEIVGMSVPATEHSTMVANTSADGNRDEYEAFKHLITEVYPSGIVSVVSDSYDFWKVVEETLPRLKKDIMKRDGKTVIRPDSGDPVDIICGKHMENISDDEWVKNLEDAKSAMQDILEERVRDETEHGEHGDSNPTGEFRYNGKYYRIELEIFWNRHDKQYYYIDDVDVSSFEEFTPKVEDLGLIESLYNLFGGSVNELGYKVLDSHIGAIYGDAITLDRAEEICERLTEKGFATTNVTLGIGSYSFQYNTRDTFGFAMKATYAIIDGKEQMLFKDPKTDQGKRSQRGMVAVVQIGENIHCEDGLTQRMYDSNFKNIDKLEIVFKNGQLIRDENLVDIRELLNNK